MSDFRVLRYANAERDKEWNTGSEPVSLAFRGNELGGECGEALNIIKKLERMRIGIRGSTSNKAALMEELADIIICADLIAMHVEGDLWEAVREKFNATSQKYNLSTRLA